MAARHRYTKEIVLPAMAMHGILRMPIHLLGLYCLFILGGTLGVRADHHALQPVSYVIEHFYIEDFLYNLLANWRETSFLCYLLMDFIVGYSIVTVTL